MSAKVYRNQLDRKRKQRLAAEKKASEFRAKESRKRDEAAKARQAVARTRSSSTQSSKLRESERKENEAAAAAKTAGDWARKASRYSNEEAGLIRKVSKAEQTETLDAEKRRKSAEQQA